MMIRRLEPVSDRGLLEESRRWIESAPRWLREADSVLGEEGFEAFYGRAFKDSHVDVGVFEDGLIGLFSATLLGHGVYEAHLRARRGAKLELIGEAGFQLLNQLFEVGANVVFIWTATVNRAARIIADLSGLRPDGITIIKGAYKVTRLDGTENEKVIEWQRYNLSRAEWEWDVKTQNNTKYDADAELLAVGAV